MKKKILFTLGTLAATLAVLPLFAAFEAHVVNVTARIENALTVPVEVGGINFGTVFPEEVLHKNLDINLSQSFLDEPRVDDIEYMIRQKPKCGLPDPQNPGQYLEFEPAKEDAQGNFSCANVTGDTHEGAYVMLPLLCPYLSKHSEIIDNDPLTYEDGHIDAFHGPLTNWTLEDTISSQVFGHLTKQGGDTKDTWDIDLHAPCFSGQCAQDNVIPVNYQADPKDEHQIFGCDLWVEVTGVSLPEITPEKGTLTVIKHVINDDSGQALASAFTMNITGTNVSNPSFAGAESPGVVVTLDPGPYSVDESGGPAGYAKSLSAECTGPILAGQSRTCTITNDDNDPTTGTLTVHKVVVGSNANPNSFALFIDGSPVTNDVANVELPGDYTVSETPNTDYTTAFGPGCDANTHVANVAIGQNTTCTVTNTRKTGTITVLKDVVNHEVGTKVAADFQMTIDGNNVAQGVPINLPTGPHTVSEVDSMGYVKAVGVDCAADGSVTVVENQNKNCTVTNDQPFGTITVSKTVNNLFGGLATVGDFSYFVDATGVTNNIAKNFAPGTYTVTELGVSGYEGTFGGDCDPNTQQITIAAGNAKTCTITNVDIKPVVTIIKNVINDNGGSANAQSFLVRVDGTPVASGGSKSVTSNANHAITEDAKAGYHFVSITGAGCPAAPLGTNFQLTPGQSITCTITNSDDGGAQ